MNRTVHAKPETRYGNWGVAFTRYASFGGQTFAASGWMYLDNFLTSHWNTRVIWE